MRVDNSPCSHYWSSDQMSLRGPLGDITASSFAQLTRVHRERGVLFEDKQFPTCNQIIFNKNKPTTWPLVWKRPHEICSNPKFIATTPSSVHVDQGDLGSCWLLAAISCLVSTPKLLARIVPSDQSFDSGYCGLFRFRFWHFGEWIEVVVDDRLLTHRGQLVSLHSASPGEFWVSLLEKAYAKMYGSYEDLKQSCMTEVLQDLTGGIVQSFSVTALERTLTYRVINSAVPRSTLLVATIQLQNKRQLRLRNGLLSYHAFAITGLARVRTTIGEVLLVRLHNPWGRGNWNGSWSDKSWEWESLSDRGKELLDNRGENDKEFWMAFDDFVCAFTNLDLVHVGPDDWLNEPALHSKKPWRAVLARRRWRIGYNAGGGPKNTDTVSVNPHFYLHIPRNGCSKCHVVISVMQNYQLKKTKRKKILFPIGFAVYEVPENVPRLHCQILKDKQPLDVTNHCVARETVTFFTLSPGDYVILPCTEDANCDIKFLLRIYTDQQSNTWEVNDDNAIFRYPQMEKETNSKKQPNYTLILNKMIAKYPLEIDAEQLLKILRSFWRNLNVIGKPNLELCKTLIMLRDIQICGRINLEDVPKILCSLYYWQNSFLKFDKMKSNTISSYSLRALLWETGVSVSNKVLECLVLRFAKENLVHFDSFLLAMVRLYLAHDRYHHLGIKLPANPLSPEEVSKIILMTIYA